MKITETRLEDHLIIKELARITTNETDIRIIKENITILSLRHLEIDMRIIHLEKVPSLIRLQHLNLLLQTYLFRHARNVCTLTVSSSSAAVHIGQQASSRIVEQ